MMCARQTQTNVNLRKLCIGSDACRRCGRECGVLAGVAAREGQERGRAFAALTIAWSADGPCSMRFKCALEGKAAANSTPAINRQNNPDTKNRIRMLSSFLCAGMAVSLRIMPNGNLVYACTRRFATQNMFGL